MPRRDIVVVAASAGGIEALRHVVGGLPADLPAAVAVVVHMGPAGGDALATILDRSGPVPAHVAVDGEPLRHGAIYVCRGDHHLLVADGNPHVDVRGGPRENGHRPAADSLFRSAAVNFGPRVIGVVLSGMLRDGAAGLAAIRESGGLAVVQDPADAIHPAMPVAAIGRAGADHVAPATLIGALIAQLVRGEATDPASAAAAARVGGRTARTSVEDSMWVALAALEARIASQDRLLERTKTTGMVLTGARLRDDLDEMHRSATTLRDFLEHDADRSGTEPAPGEHVG